MGSATTSVTNQPSGATDAGGHPYSATDSTIGNQAFRVTNLYAETLSIVGVVDGRP